MPKLEVVKCASDEQKHGDDVEVVKVHGDKVYSADDEGKVKVWDFDLNLIHEFKAHNYAVNDLVIVGNNLFTGCADCTIKVWDLSTYELKKNVEGHEECVRKMMTDGKYVYAGDDKGEVRVYTLDGEYERVYSMVEEVWGLHAEGNTFYTVRDRGLTITEAKGESNKFTVMSSTAEGRAPLHVAKDVLAYVDREGMTVLIHDNTPGSYKLKGKLQGHDRIITALTGRGNFMVTGAWDSKVKLWDLTSCKELGSCDVPSCPNGVAITEDNLVFAGGMGGFIQKLKIS